MQLKSIVTLAAISLLSTSALAYDAKLAAQFDQFVQPMTQDGLAHGATGGMPPDKFLEALAAGKKITVLDIRTPNEAAIYGINLPNTLRVPMTEVFKPENLKKLPNDGMILVVCTSGVRSPMVHTMLQNIGFKNTKYLHLGTKGLANLVDPHTAPQL
jgi:rhodanese-related sulfurtransferase